MLIAVGRSPEGKKMLIVGLEEENIKKLRNDEPIYKNLSELNVPELADWDLSIVGPEDLIRFMSHFGVKP